MHILKRVVAKTLVGAKQYPRIVVCAWLALAVVAGALSRDLEIDSDVSSFLDVTSPDWQTYEDLVQTFGSDGFLTIVLPYDGAELGPALVTLEALTQELGELDAVDSVQSLANYRKLRRSGPAEITTTPLVEDGRFCESCLELALQDTYVVNSGLLSADGSALGLVVRLGSVGAAERQEAVRIARQLALARAPSAMVSGVPLFREAILERTISEMRVLGPAAAIAVALVVMSLLRSLAVVWCGLSVGLVAVLVTLGLMSVVGVPLSLTTLTLPAILFALAMAYSVHITLAHNSGDCDRANLLNTAILVVLSGFTTSAGFFAMSAVEVSAIQDLGMLGGVGVVTIVLAVTTLVPALLDWSRFQGVSHTGPGLAAAAWIARMGPRSSTAIIAFWALLLVAGLVGVHRLRLESDIVQWFPSGDPVRDDYEGIRASISGITPLAFVFDTDGKNMVSDPGAASALAAFLDYVRQDPIVGGAVGYTELVSMANQVVGGEKGVPSDSAGIAQLLLLLRGDDSLDRLISRDGRSALVVARINVNGSRAILELAGRAKMWWAAEGDDRIRISSTGIMFEYARAQELITRRQLLGLSLAVFMIAAVLFSSCRDRVLLAMVLIASVVPIVCVYGVFGMLGLPVDAATVSVAAVAIGIAVDDSVHVAARYGGFRELGVEPIGWARLIPALVVTTAVVCVGFGVLGLSGFTVVERLGAVTACAVSLSLASDLTLLPALLRAVGRDAS